MKQLSIAKYSPENLVVAAVVSKCLMGIHFSSFIWGVWDYLTLQKFVLLYCRDGLTSQGYYKNIKSSYEANEDVVFSCDYQTWLKGCDGFVTNIDWNFSQVFNCPNCGISQKFFTRDGK